uniref:Ig-like domain-containing protein n=1 Tax=Urocitellus parryii TaxID=9999 RepID=A0A8D2IGZ8_UROPR
GLAQDLPLLSFFLLRHFWNRHTYGDYGQFTYGFDGDELFYIDLEKKKETVWRHPEFSNFVTFEIQKALRNPVVVKKKKKKKKNLDTLIKDSNITPATNEIPEVAVTLGIPNTLICLVDDIFPPMSNITWFCNGHLVPEGIAETTFYPKSDHSFLKFSYLTFVPSTEYFYDCKVEHWGLERPLLKHWERRTRNPLPDCHFFRFHFPPATVYFSRSTGGTLHILFNIFHYDHWERETIVGYVPT